MVAPCTLPVFWGEARALPGQFLRRCGNFYPKCAGHGSSGPGRGENFRDAICALAPVLFRLVNELPSHPCASFSPVEPPIPQTLVFADHAIVGANRRLGTMGPWVFRPFSMILRSSRRLPLRSSPLWGGTTCAKWVVRRFAQFRAQFSNFVSICIINIIPTFRRGLAQVCAVPGCAQFGAQIVRSCRKYAQLQFGCIAPFGRFPVATENKR